MGFEYVEAVRLTTELRDEGRWGTAGAVEVVEEDEGVLDVVVVVWEALPVLEVSAAIRQ